MGRIDLEMLLNTRDLGGIKTKDDYLIKENMLIRSGALYGLSENDVENLLDHDLSLVVDFRTNQEKRERPDPVISDVEYSHLSVLKEDSLGISREEATFQEMIIKVVSDPNATTKTMKDFMVKSYENLVEDSFCCVQYSKFLDMVLSNDRGATLWHCTAGKDRAGFATVIILEILGVDREFIFEDYLYTNVCLKSEIDGTISRAYILNNNDDVKGKLHALLGTDEIYLSALYNKINEIYGSFEEYLEKALGVDEEKINMFRNKFLYRRGLSWQEH